MRNSDLLKGENKNLRANVSSAYAYKGKTEAIFLCIPLKKGGGGGGLKHPAITALGKLTVISFKFRVNPYLHNNQSGDRMNGGKGKEWEGIYTQAAHLPNSSETSLPLI